MCSICLNKSWSTFSLLLCFTGLSMKPQFSGMNSWRAVFWSCSTASTMLKWMWKYCASLSSLSQLGQMCCLPHVKLMPRLTCDYVSWLFFTVVFQFLQTSNACKLSGNKARFVGLASFVPCLKTIAVHGRSIASSPGILNSDSRCLACNGPRLHHLNNFWCEVYSFAQRWQQIGWNWSQSEGGLSCVTPAETLIHADAELGGLRSLWSVWRRT